MQIEGRTDGQHPLTQAQIVGVTESKRGQILRLNLDERHIGRGVSTHQLGIKRATIVEFYLEFGSLLDNVVVGHDITVGRDNHTRTTRALLAGLRLAITATTIGDTEKLIEGIITARTATILHLADRLDIHHGLHSVLGCIGKVGILLGLISRKMIARLRGHIAPRCSGIH